jgi:HlyD family secretion protein
VGQTVAAAVIAPVLFTIATDLSHLQVLLDVDQSDIAGIEVGQPVTFEVESYPDETFRGTVTQVRLQPIAEQSAPATTVASSTIAQTTTSVATVVSYATMIDVDNPGERLRPGMTASVVLSGARRKDALRIPNSVLSFRPSQAVLRALGQADPIRDEAEAAVTASDTGTKPRDLWKFDGKRFTPVSVRVGLSDDRWTEVIGGTIHRGDAIVTRAGVLQRSRF